MWRIKQPVGVYKVFLLQRFTNRDVDFLFSPTDMVSGRLLNRVRPEHLVAFDIF